MQELLEAAREASAAAYAPYSDFPVGAALRTDDGRIVTGCNIENANYANSLHAEEVALGTAVRDGHTAFAALAVSAPEQPGLTPCGTCRQSLAEFCDEAFEVLCDTGPDNGPAGDKTDADSRAETGTEATVYTLGELLPAAMGPADLGIEP